MPKLRFLSPYLIQFFLSLLIWSQSAHCQNDSLNQARTNDTVKSIKEIIPFIQEMGKQETEKSINKFRSGQIAIRQTQIIKEISFVILKAKDYLKRGIDTSGLQSELIRSLDLYNIAADGVFTNPGSIQTYRNLNTSYDFMNVLLRKLKSRKNIIDKYQNDLLQFREQIDSLATDSTIYIFPSDSASFFQYYQKLTAVTSLLGPTDSLIDKSSASLSNLDAALSPLINQISSSLEDIESFQKKLSSSSFEKELPGIFGPVTHKRPFSEIIKFSIAKEGRVLKYYTAENKGRLILMVAIIIGMAIFISSLKKKISDNKVNRNDYTGQLVFRYPILSAILISVNLLQFIFPTPPFVFSLILWITAALSLTFIFLNYISKYWMEFWLTMLAFFILASADNLILQVSRTERWGMFILELGATFTASLILLKGHRFDLKEKKILYFIGLVVLLELAAFIANWTGRYNISKSLFFSGFLNIIIAISFLWTARLINQLLKVASNFYSSSDKSKSVLNFEKLSSNIPTFLYVVLGIGWLMLFGRNFYFFKEITQPFIDLLFNERKIGDYSFSIYSILLFFLIMTFSVILSKIVSFFTSETYTSQNKKSRKLNIGSWVLLIRISIICIGLFLAFAAAGIPMDRITIILGALGVGIGLGLQALVNNLVSGLIIAFEKPVNVGDIVEVSGISGRMKSIGFRSSVVATWDGADVIIPNGDILNAHLINWSMGNNNRRTDFMIGVAYGTDLDKAKKIIQDIIEAENNILKNPQPTIIFQEFGNSSIDIKIFYWVNHFNHLASSKSNLIFAIDQAFKQNNIEIPFPQQDLHIKSVINNESKKENK